MVTPSERGQTPAADFDPVKPSQRNLNKLIHSKLVELVRIPDGQKKCGIFLRHKYLDNATLLWVAKVPTVPPEGKGANIPKRFNRPLSVLMVLNHKNLPDSVKYFFNEDGQSAKIEFKTSRDFKFGSPTRLNSTDYAVLLNFFYSENSIIKEFEPTE